MAEKTEAQKRAQKNYMEKFSRVELRMDKGSKKLIEEFANRAGESVTSYITTATIQRIQREQLELTGHIWFDEQNEDDEKTSDIAE